MIIMMMRMMLMVIMMVVVIQLYPVYYIVDEGHIWGDGGGHSRSATASSSMRWLYF